MKIPADAEIPDNKLIRYLLIYKERNDKSKFLAQAGFTEKNPEALCLSIQLLIESAEATEDRTDEYGTFYQVEGDIIGRNSIALSVTTIWLQRQHDSKYQFVTLKPRKKTRYDT